MFLSHSPPTDKGRDTDQGCEEIAVNGWTPRHNYVFWEFPIQDSVGSRRPSSGSVLGQRLRRWSSTEPELGQHPSHVG